MLQIAIDWIDDVKSTNLMKHAHKLIKNNTPCRRTCETKYFSCDLDTLDRNFSNTEELVELQITILNQVYENK